MVQFLTDLLFAPEAPVEQRITFDFDAWDLDRDLTAPTQIPAPVDRGGSAGRNEVLERVVIDLAAGKDGWHDRFDQSEDMTKALKKS